MTLTTTSKRIVLTRRSPRTGASRSITAAEHLRPGNDSATQRSHHSAGSRRAPQSVVFDSAVAVLHDPLRLPGETEDTTRLPTGPIGLGPERHAVRLSRAPSCRSRRSGAALPVSEASCPGLRHALRQPRKGHPGALRGRSGGGAWRRPWPAAAPDGTRPRAGSASGSRRYSGRPGRAVRLRQPLISGFDLDAFVDSLATRIASFDKQAISETKHFADVASLPPDFEIAPEWDVCLASIGRPAAQREDQDADGNAVFTSRETWNAGSDITSVCLRCRAMK